MKKNLFSVRTIAVSGILIAINIILARFLSLQAWNLRIGFSFLSYVIAGVLYGPVVGAVVGGAGDILGAVLFPTGGAYFPGFTLTAILRGIIFGLFLHKKVTLPRVIGAVALEQCTLSLLLNSFWISVMYGKGFLALLPARAGQAALMIVVETVTIMVLEKTLFGRLRNLS